MEAQNADADCNTETESCNNFERALVPYVVQAPIQQLRQKKKNVQVGPWNLEIAQDWQDHGVAGVLWDAVSHFTPPP